MKDPPLILIVDDEPNVVSVLKLAFRGKPWQVDAIDDAAEALQWLNEIEYDVLIVDKNLPDMDGLELIHRVRARGRRLGIIVITGYASLQSALDTANLAVDAYIEKPFADIFEIAKVVEQVLVNVRRPHLARARVAEIVARTRSVPPTGGEASAHETYSAAGESARFVPRIVVAAAHPVQRTQIVRQLEDAGAEFVPVNSSETLQEVIERENPHGVIVQGANDVEADVARVRGLSSRVAILVVSRRLDLATVKALILQQVAGIVTAPPDSREFGVRVQQLVQGLKQAAEEYEAAGKVRSAP
jgi:DNA-binding response OmpR family regulator